MSHDCSVYTLSKKCRVYCWLGNGKARHEPPDRRPPRGLLGLAGLRVDAPSEARGAGGVGCCRCAVNEDMAAWRVCSHCPIGGRREACWAWTDNESTRRVKLAARAASGRAGLAVAGDLAGLRRWLEIWRGCGRGGDLAGLRAAQIRKTGDPKATGYLCVMGDLNPQPAD